MGSGPPAPLAAGICFVLAALLHARNWRAGAGARGTAPVAIAAAGVAILVGALAARGLLAGRWPLISEYEFGLAFALATALATLVLTAGQADLSPAVEAVTFLMAAGLVAYARLGVPAFKRVIQPLPPALDSGWLPLHVGAAAIGYGALAVAGAAALVSLVRRSNGYPLGGIGQTGGGRLMGRGISVGYPFLTLSMLLGMVWAQVAWGRYWGWDVKEVWTLVTWLIYTLYWHVRRRPRWQGRRLAWLVLAGFAAVLFTFLGVGWLAREVGLESLHLF